MNKKLVLILLLQTLLFYIFNNLVLNNYYFNLMSLLVIFGCSFMVGTLRNNDKYIYPLLSCLLLLPAIKNANYLYLGTYLTYSYIGILIANFINHFHFRVFRYRIKVLLVILDIIIGLSLIIGTSLY